MKNLCVGLFAGAAGWVLVVPLSAVASSQAKEQIVHSFGDGSDGSYPWASLIEVNGTLYGTTYRTGPDGYGTIFSLDPTTGVEQVLYSFCSQQNCVDGEHPQVGLANARGRLYGTTYVGGTNGSGTVFMLDPATDAETLVYSFCSLEDCTDGAMPEAGLLDVKDILYGTTYYGGTRGRGTVYSLDPNSGVETVLYSFCSKDRRHSCTDGEHPSASLIDVKGELYGTTYAGGTQYGTVFSFNPNTGVERVIHSFCSSDQGCEDGLYPDTGLIDMNGVLYGTTYLGGPYGHGTVFALDPGNGTEAVPYSFCSKQNCVDGATPYAALLSVDGVMYGTTYAGGAGNLGTVFSFDPGNGEETVLHSFCSTKDCRDGAYPSASLIDVKGALYGTTRSGGAYGAGTAFRLKKP